MSNINRTSVPLLSEADSDLFRSQACVREYALIFVPNCTLLCLPPTGQTLPGDLRRRVLLFAVVTPLLELLDAGKGERSCMPALRAVVAAVKEELRYFFFCAHSSDDAFSDAMGKKFFAAKNASSCFDTAGCRYGFAGIL